MGLGLDRDARARAVCRADPTVTGVGLALVAHGDADAGVHFPLACAGQVLGCPSLDGYGGDGVGLGGWEGSVARIAWHIRAECSIT